MSFFFWSFPGAIAMYGLSLGVQQMSEILPDPVYALLSGLNASTVGIIALAAVQLAEKAISDQWTRILVIFGACAGLCYNALWYFPVLIAIGGIATFIWEGPVKSALAKLCQNCRQHRGEDGSANSRATEEGSIAIDTPASSSNLVQRRAATPSSQSRILESERNTQVAQPSSPPSTSGEITLPQEHKVQLSVGISLVIGFFASFLAIMLLRALLKPLTRIAAVFANMYLAGTIIFGGGPVVIPLLRSYVVDPGWVSSRDFLIGLAIIQALPGPNFNFAVYLAALAVQKTSVPTIVGALLGFVGIFTPGLTLAVAVQSFWSVLRSKKWVIDILRGINATAVGLVFTAVYRLWELGYLTSEASQEGRSLGLEPFWVVVTAVSYAESAWFKVPPAVAIVIGAVLGLVWYGIVQA
jgi:chromate transport protein ChrA